MKADSKEVVRDATLKLDQSVADPFAVDMFTARSVLPESSSGVLRVSADEPPLVPLNVSWHFRLPRVTPGQMEASAAIAALTPELYGLVQSSVVTVLARYTMNAPAQISLSLAELREIDFASEAVPDEDSPRVFATFVSEPNGPPVSIELEARFAVMLIDRMLGGDGSPPDSLRSLTTAERAAFEFLCLSAASELNDQMREPLMRLQSITEQPPWSVNQLQNSTEVSTREIWKRGLAASLRVGVGERTGIAWVHLNAHGLSALDQALRRLHATGQASNRPATVEGEVARYARVAPDLSLSVLIGTTDVTLEELLQLERGDVMLVEWPALVWRREGVSGPVRIRVGDAEETLIAGEVTEIGSADPSEGSAVDSTLEQDVARQSGTIRLRVGSLTVGAASKFAERLNMQEEAENGEALAEGANLIDGVMLTVHVELAARRLRLDELLRLRANQILDLGCQATDPVDLIIDGRRVARGELVDIEGRLGVRITQMLG